MNTHTHTLGLILLKRKQRGGRWKGGERSWSFLHICYFLILWSHFKFCDVTSSVGCILKARFLFSGLASVFACSKHKTNHFSQHFDCLLLKIYLKPGVVVHAFNPATLKAQAGGLSNFKGSTVTSMSARTRLQDSVSKKGGECSSKGEKWSFPPTAGPFSLSGESVPSQASRELSLSVILLLS